MINKLHVHDGSYTENQLLKMFRLDLDTLQWDECQTHHN